MATTVWVAVSHIYLGTGAQQVLAYTPGNIVPDDVVARYGLATSNLVQTATVNPDGTSPNYRGTDLVTQAELDARIAALPGGQASVTSINGLSGAVILDADGISETATRVYLAPAERTRLAGVATGATANDTDAALRDRATHTGTQAAATISDLTESVQDIVGTFVVAGTGITSTYDDVANRLTIASTASGGVPTTRQIASGAGLAGGGDLSADRTLSVVYGTAAGTAAQGNDSRLSDARTPLAHTHPATDISNSTATGRSVITATDAAAARTAIGAGTSNLAIGTTSTTAAAGSHTHTAAAVGAVEAVTAGLKARVMTQAAYDGLATKDATTLYIIQG